MPHYLIQVGYNSDGIAALVREPQDRIEKVRPAVESLGGSIESGYYAFGEYDIILVVEMPDNAEQAAEYWTFRRARGGPWMVSAIQQAQ